MNVPPLDLTRQYAAIKDEIDQAVRTVFETQHFVLGPEVEKLEEAVAECCRAAHAVGCASGSDAILLALMAIGVGPGDEVITTTYTFFATAGCIARLGAKPVFVDIEPDTYNIDPSQIEAKITDKTKAIMPVHLYGQCADMDAILALAHKHGLKVVEDAAQAIGAEYKGKRAGAIGHLGCISFYPTKNLGGAGDGGMVVTNDGELADRIGLLRVHGARPKYYHEIVGLNSRLDALQAAVLNVKIQHLDEWNRARRERAACYDQAFSGVDVQTPATRGGCTHTYHQYVIQAADRDGLFEHLRAKGVGCMLYYPMPLHVQKCFSDLGYAEGDLPVAEAAAKGTLALPIFPELEAREQDYVVQCVREFIAA